MSDNWENFPGLIQRSSDFRRHQTQSSHSPTDRQTKHLHLCRFSLISSISGYVFRITFAKSLSNNCQFTGFETGENLERLPIERKGLFNDL